MAPPAAVYVVAAVVGVAAVVAFKEFVYEPHIAPRIEAWAEDFLQRRRAARNRRASAVPVRTAHRRRSSSGSSHPSNGIQRDPGANDRVPGSNDLPADGFELEALAAREVDEWRNEVLRSQEWQRDGLRRRRTDLHKDDFDSFDMMSSTLDESFTSLTHTPLATTHVISNVSSPITPSTVSLPLTPTRRHRSESQSTTTQGDASTVFVAPHSPPSPTREIPVMSPRAVPSPGPTPRPPTDDPGHPGIASPTPLAISSIVRASSATENVTHPLPFTPTNQVMSDDSPFGPLLPDTPRSSAEIYGQRPFSPITRVMGSSSDSVSAIESRGTLSSRANSANSVRTLGSSGVLRRNSALANEVITSANDDNDEENHLQASASAFGSVISSLSERYPAPLTPPIIISSPVSSVGIISPPSSPHSGGSGVVVHHDALFTAPHPSAPLPQENPSLPVLQLPLPLSSPHSAEHSAASPAVSYVSFLSPMPISRAASESEGDEFLSIASDNSDSDNDSEWERSPVTSNGQTGPVHDRVNNPFLDFEHLTPDGRANGSEHGDGSEGSEVLVSDAGQEGGSEVGSDESWGSARRY